MRILKSPQSLEMSHKKTAADWEEQAQCLTLYFMRKIPKIRAIFETDVEAAYEGDPATESKDEIIFSYPGLYAITIYRIAHPDNTHTGYYVMYIRSKCGKIINIFNMCLLFQYRLV